MKKILTIMILSLVSAGIFAGESVAIVYNNGRVAVNRETAKYIIKQSKKLGLDYQYKTVDVQKIKSIEDYKAVIILNTGVISEKLDPVLESFIGDYSNRSKFILLTFIKGSKELEAKLLTGDDALGGVDGISSASIYKGQQNTNFEWFNMLVELLE